MLWRVPVSARMLKFSRKKHTSNFHFPTSTLQYRINYCKQKSITFLIYFILQKLYQNLFGGQFYIYCSRQALFYRHCKFLNYLTKKSFFQKKNFFESWGKFFRGVRNFEISAIPQNLTPWYFRHFSTTETKFLCFYEFFDFKQPLDSKCATFVSEKFQKSKIVF